MPCGRGKARPASRDSRPRPAERTRYNPRQGSLLINEPHVARVQHILAKLEQVRARKLACFGSDSHRFRLAKPLSEATLAAFEQRHGIRLPGGYREFMLQAGNGGAGPYFGISPLDDWNDFHDWIGDEPPPADFLARPCPLKPGRNEQCTERNPSDYQGTISLGSQGCTYVMLLVVTGEYSGRVVYADADGQPPYMTRERDFLAWYERWLDELLLGYDMAWFGHGPGGGEEAFFQILDSPGFDDEERVEAARALLRLPRLSDAARERTPLLCGDRLAGVRAAGCDAIRKFQIGGGVDRCGTLLEDPAPEVRRNAVWAVMALAPGQHRDAVLRRLHEDANPDVASTAFFRLQEAAARLKREELLKVVSESPHADVRVLAAHAMPWQVQDSALLLRLLTDDNAQVRLYATLGLRQLKLERLPDVSAQLDKERDVHVVGSLLKYLGELGDRAAVPKLLEYCQSADDFHRLDALEALARIGDERVIPAAQAMLREERCPQRVQDSGSQTSIHSIRHLARECLATSPNAALRDLARPYAASVPGRIWRFLSRG